MMWVARRSMNQRSWDHQYAACKVSMGFFQCPQCIDIDVVGSSSSSSTLPPSLRVMARCSLFLSPPDSTPTFLLVGSTQIEFRQVGSDIDFVVAHFLWVRCRLRWLQRRFFQAADLHGFGQHSWVWLYPDYDLAVVGLFLAHDHFKQGRFTHTVGSNDAYHSILWDIGWKIFYQNAVCQRLWILLDVDNHITQPGARWDEQF